MTTTDKTTETNEETPQPAQDGDPTAQAGEDAPETATQARETERASGVDRIDWQDIGTETRDLPVPLDADEIAELGKRLASIEPEIDELKNEVKELNRDIKTLRGRRAVLSDEIRRGTGKRPIKVRLLARYDIGKVEIIRDDTEETVEVRGITDDERQLQMGPADPTPTCGDCALAETCTEHIENGTTYYDAPTSCGDYLPGHPVDDLDNVLPFASITKDNDCDDGGDCDDCDDCDDNNDDAERDAFVSSIVNGTIKEARALVKDCEDPVLLRDAGASESAQRGDKARKGLLDMIRRKVRSLEDEQPREIPVPKRIEKPAKPDDEPVKGEEIQDGLFETGTKGNGTWPTCHCGQPSVTTKDGEHLCAEHGFDPGDTSDDPFGDLP